MVERITEFRRGDRYLYDCDACSYANGWAQVDTTQDASYYGTWTNPGRREIFTFCEGDTTLIRCVDNAEYAIELRRVADWNRENGYWLGIDPGFRTAFRDRFMKLGLADLLHPGYLPAS